jgi:4-hydroxybenzoyl-CoA thioesterase
LSKANITNRKTIQIEWGDCDPAQIVHYPRYLAHFDACTTALFKTTVYAGAPAASSIRGMSDSPVTHQGKFI